jgi:hypothetical protein
MKVGSKRCSRERCYDFKNIFAQNLAKKLAFFTQNKDKFSNNLIITLVFKKNANFFAEIWEKIAENCDHNIDPRILKIFLFIY